MEIQDALLSRRSIRKYSSIEPTQAELEQILRAAMYAPSALDQRPWQFVVIRRREILSSLADKMSHCDMLREATAGILVCADLTREKIPGFWVQDCSACTQNILLSAHGLAMGAVWLGVHPIAEREDALREKLALPPKIIPFALVALGYPDEAPQCEERFEVERIHLESW